MTSGIPSSFPPPTRAIATGDVQRIISFASMFSIMCTASPPAWRDLHRAELGRAVMAQDDVLHHVDQRLRIFSASINSASLLSAPPRSRMLTMWPISVASVAER